MNKVLIIYFSGTGNTWMMAQAIGDEFKKKGFDLDFFATEQIPSSIDYSQYQMLGIGFPVYAWCFPSNIRRLIKRLPSSQGHKAFIFSTMQDKSLGSEALLGRYLTRKGYRVLGARPFLVVNNETIYYGPADPDDPKTSEMIEKMKAQAPAFVEEIISGKGQKHHDSTFWVLLSQLTGMAFDLLDGYPASRNFKILEKCTNCGICERICPEANIFGSLTWPRFRNRCLMCERCVNFCPEKAIVHPLHRAPHTDIRYRAPGYRPPFMRKPTRWGVDELPETEKDLKPGLVS